MTMPEQSPTLRDMIQRALSGGLTLRELADRALDPRSGESVSKDTINKIALGRVTRMPTEAHLRGIAAGLKLPYERVRQAAIEQWLPADDPTNSEAEERERLLAEAKQMRADADRMRAIADETIARIDRESGGEHPHPQTA
jgi:transcriptional regulator with XRE-family HTH domain